MLCSGRQRNEAEESENRRMQENHKNQTNDRRTLPVLTSQVDFFGNDLSSIPTFSQRRLRYANQINGAVAIVLVVCRIGTGRSTCSSGATWIRFGHGEYFCRDKRIAALPGSFLYLQDADGGKMCKLPFVTTVMKEDGHHYLLISLRQCFFVC